MANQEVPAGRPQEGLTVRDRLWLWGHDAGSHNEGHGLPGPSRITPAEAAAYLGIPNLLMVRYKGRPPLPLDGYAVPLRALRRVVWSAVGAHGQTDEGERAHVLALAAREPNVTGLILDDFFLEEPAPGGEPAALSLDELRELREQLSVGGRRLDLWAVLYEHQLGRDLAAYLGLIDVVSLWAWQADRVPGLGDGLGRLEALAPGCGKALGCYLWDYGGKRPMPLELLQGQCEAGLGWLRQGRIAGIIFLASCLCDLGLQAVEWTRGWIAQVGDEPL
jgi:hypothetical protein